MLGHLPFSSPASDYFGNDGLLPNTTMQHSIYN